MSEESKQDINKARRRDTIDKINRDILKIEEKANALIEGVNIEELAAADRMELYIKFLSQKTRMMALKNSLELDEPEVRESAFMIAFQRHLRGEKPGEIDG